MKKHSPSSGQNGQLVLWWLVVHFGQLYRSFNLLEGTIFSYCKIQARERPENTKEKIKLVFMIGESFSYVGKISFHS